MTTAMSPTAPSSNPGKAATLRRALLSGRTMYFMEAHDGLSALIAQRSGFRALWASGLAISTAIGLRDASEICASEMLKVVERMAEVTTVPILVDVDAGYGNFNNLRLIARRLATYGVAGICVEDKLHPKLNSYCEGAHNLAEIEEFCGRLRAVRDDQGPDGVVIVARTETLIAGRPMDEALERAKAYSEAGADAILIHSKRQDAEEVIEFAARWRGELPLLAVPTTYYRTSAKVLQQAGVAGIIWANHSIRSAMRAMQQTCAEIKANDSIEPVETKVAAMSEIFELLRYSDLERDERNYLPGAIRAQLEAE